MSQSYGTPPSQTCCCLRHCRYITLSVIEPPASCLQVVRGLHAQLTGYSVMVGGFSCIILVRSVPTLSWLLSLSYTACLAACQATTGHHSGIAVKLVTGAFHWGHAVRQVSLAQPTLNM
jgi:hypothetical protein